MGNWGDDVDYETPEVDAIVYVNAAAIYKFSATGTELEGAKFKIKDQHARSIRQHAHRQQQAGEGGA